MRFPRHIENLVANLRGLPEDRNRSILRPTYPIDTLLEVIVEQYRIGQERPVEVIMRDWKNIMGAENAPRCRPIRMEGDRRLIVAVANPTLRQELQFQRGMILNRLRRLSGCGDIEEIQFRAG